MTIDSPKGPGREARPEEVSSLRERLIAALMSASQARQDLSDAEGNEPDLTPEEWSNYLHTLNPRDAANAVLAEVSPEVERLTAEVERLKRQALVDRYLLRSMARRASLLRRRADRWRSRAEQEFRNRVTDTAKAMAESGQQRGEVSRLREQLATATELVDHLLLQFATGEKGHPGSPCVRTRWIEESAIARFYERRAGLGVSEVEAPQPQEMTQHKVIVEPCRETMWDAYCVTLGCGQHRSGSLEQAQDWKGQHLADTLRPVSAWDLPSPSLRKEGDDRTEHVYLSTACLHDQCGYCVAPVVSREGAWKVVGPSYSADPGAPKNPARCKFCSAPCRCRCHMVGSVSTPPAGGDSDTTARVWRDVRGCEWEDVAPHDELRLIRTDPSHCREVGGPTFSRRYVEAHYGPLTEVLSCTEQEEK